MFKTATLLFGEALNPCRSVLGEKGTLDVGTPAVPYNREYPLRDVNRVNEVSGFTHSVTAPHLCQANMTFCSVKCWEDV